MRTYITALLLPALTGWLLSPPAKASGHGPVFGLATPTNPKGGFSFDTNLMGRAGAGSGFMFRPALGYGVTENFKVSISAPLVLKAEPFAASRLSAFTSMMGDFEGTAIWRFHRQDTGIGSRVESALIGGLVAPGPQAAGGLLQPIHSGLGALVGGVTGIASRSHYAWGALPISATLPRSVTAVQTYCSTRWSTPIAHPPGAPTAVGTGESLAR